MRIPTQPNFALRHVTALSPSTLGVLVFCCSTAILFAHGTHGQLMEAINRKLESSPDNANLWYQRGFLNLEHEDPAQALADLEKAENLAPGKLPTFWLKGQALELSGRHPEARAAFDVHIQRFPDDGRGYSSRARILLKLGAPQEALADYRKSLAKSPDAEPDLVQEAAVALDANGSPEEAIQVLEAGMKRLGQIPSLTIRALEIEMKTGRYDSALARVETIRKSAPRQEPWMAKRAEMLGHAGRPEESRAAWQTLIDHLAQLPNLERGSNSMSLLAEQARQSVANLSKTEVPDSDSIRPHKNPIP
jgi:tetratricopeptide (TPR) repeat protein